MKTLDRHIGISLAFGFLLVALILAVLFSFIEIVLEIDDIGKGNYRIQDVFYYVTLTAPRRTLDLLPLSALLGSILAMGHLADGNELLAMRSVGLSVQRICWSVLGNGAVLMLIAGLMAEFVVPPMEQHARMRRSLAISDPGFLLKGQGFWARNRNSLIRVRNTLKGGVPVGVDIYELDPDGRLQSIIRARSADVVEHDHWLLRDVQKSVIQPDGMITRHQFQTLRWEVSLLSSEQINVLGLPPDSLSPSELYTYVGALKSRGENADNYSLALWQKITVPFTTGVMILLSLPFVFGPPRGGGGGKRIVLGSVVGIAFYLTSQIIGQLGLLLDLHPAITTVSPVVVILFAALWLMGRGR